MLDLFTHINVDWMGIRKPLVLVSVTILMAGLVSAIGRQLIPGGTDAFNLGVDFQGGTVITAKFKNGKPNDEDIRSALESVGLGESVIQDSLDKGDEVLIKVPLLEGHMNGASGSSTPGKGSASNKSAGASNSNSSTATNTNTNSESTPKSVSVNQVNKGRQLVKQALDTFGKEARASVSLDQDKDAKYKIVGTASVGPVAGKQLRNQAVIATLLGMVGILLFIAFRYDWTYAAGAVIAVFHDVLTTLAFFTIFQWEINLTVLAALLTLVGFSVNDSIVIFDRIRENLTIKRTLPLYKLTNESINQTMSRTIISSGLVFLSVLALVLFGGEVLRSFSLALLVGAITGTYSTIAIASPIAIWWQGKLGEAKLKETKYEKEQKLASAARRSVRRRPVSR